MVVVEKVLYYGGFIVCLGGGVWIFNNEVFKCCGV